MILVEHEAAFVDAVADHVGRLAGGELQIVR
jgi:ABC-type polar amino acid transport system ATPase subunit